MTCTIEAIEQIRKMFVGYHVEIELYPAGGRVIIQGCSDCGTDEIYRAAFWKHKKGEDIDKALKVLQSIADKGG